MLFFLQMPVWRKHSFREGLGNTILALRLSKRANKLKGRQVIGRVSCMEKGEGERQHKRDRGEKKRESGWREKRKGEGEEKGGGKERERERESAIGSMGEGEM